MIKPWLAGALLWLVALPYDADAREKYGRTPAEAAENIFPADECFPPGHVKRYGAKVDGIADDTKAFELSLRQAYRTGGSNPVWPAGTAVISTLSIVGPVHVRTAGYATILQHKVGQLSGIPVLHVVASNVEIDAISIQGNIRSDSDEHNHAIEVGGKADVMYVVLHGLRARDIRGDALYLGGTTAHPLRYVTTGAIDGTNILRNIVSITGGAHIKIASITGSAIGYRHFDVEPNPSGNQPPTDIEVGYIRGADIQFVGDASAPIGSVKIERAELDNSLVQNSSPGYSHYPGTNGFAAIVANARELRFGMLKIRGFPGLAIHCPTSAYPSALRIDVLDTGEIHRSSGLISTDGLRLLEIGGRAELMR